MFSFLTEPSYPRAAIGLEKERIALLSLRKEGRGLGVRSAASLEIPSAVLQPNFFETNVVDRQAFRSLLHEAATIAGLLGQKNWSVALPNAAARTSVLTLEGGAKNEAEEVLEWKAEQTFGAPAAYLRITKHRIADDIEGKPRFLATAVKLSVIDEYETVFEDLGWRAGLILPRPIGEARWLLGDENDTDALLISSQPDGFTAMLVSAGQPTVVRTVSCDPAEKDDEIYRLLMFYKDRFAAGRGSHQLDRVLAIGEDLQHTKLIEIARETVYRCPIRG